MFRLLMASLFVVGLQPLLHAQASKPNVIVIMTDDQGYGDLACHGNPHIKTPHLDALHARSVRFTNYHVSPTCAPTRSALLTGRHEFYNGITHTISERERLVLSAKTLPEELHRHGYKTGIFGKWHLGDEDEYQPGKRGFNEVFIHGAGGIGQSYPGSCGDAPGNKYQDPVIRHNGRFVTTKGYCTDVFFDAALGWMDQRRKDGPFFTLITTNAPHGPLITPPGFVLPEDGKLPADVAKFYAMIENIDTNIGKLVKQLADWKIDTETHVIFMTDNGSATGTKIFPAGMRGAKVTPYEGGTRVPLFWHKPKEIEGGKDCSALVCHWDFAVSLLDTLGLSPTQEYAAQVRGRSFAKQLKDPAAPWANRTFITHVGRWPKGGAAQAQYTSAAIRDERFALVFPAKGPRELHDLKLDPAQSKNVIAEHKEVEKQLLEIYDRWWNDVQPYLVNENAVPPKMNAFHLAYWKQYNGPGPNNVPMPK